MLFVYFAQNILQFFVDNVIFEIFVLPFLRYDKNGVYIFYIIYQTRRVTFPAKNGILYIETLKSSCDPPQTGGKMERSFFL